MTVRNGAVLIRHPDFNVAGPDPSPELDSALRMSLQTYLTRRGSRTTFVAICLLQHVPYEESVRPKNFIRRRFELEGR